MDAAVVDAGRQATSRRQIVPPAVPDHKANLSKSLEQIVSICHSHIGSMKRLPACPGQCLQGIAKPGHGVCQVADQVALPPELFPRMAGVAGRKVDPLHIKGAQFWVRIMHDALNAT